MRDRENRKYKNCENREQHIFGTRTKECNCNPTSHIGTLRGDAIIAQLTLYFGKNLELNPEVLADQREETVYEEF